MTPGIVDLFEVIYIEKDKAQPNVIAPVVLALFLEHFIKIAFVVDASQAIFYSHVSEHQVILSIVLILVGELENDMADSNLIALSQRHWFDDRLFVNLHAWRSWHAGD